MQTTELPPTFERQGDYVVSPAYGHFMRIWTVVRGVRGLSAAESNTATKLRDANGVAYLTPKMGRPGWNVRKTLPAYCIERGIPFVMMNEDGFFHFSHHGSTVRRAQ